jgi:ligand-binding sensor domain-containing protein
MTRRLLPMHKLYRYATLLLLCFNHCRAQDFPDLKFNHLSSRDGLSNDNVRCIIQDARGLIWIGTEDGLNRYDGTGFRVYRHSDTDSSSICNNDIRSMAIDNEKMIWMSTGNGLCRFDPVTGRSINYYHQKNNSNSLLHNYESTPFIDSKGRLWLATPVGIQLFDYHHNRFTTYRMPSFANADEHFNYFSRIQEDRSHRLWALSFFGAYLIDEQTGQLRPYHRDGVASMLTLYQASNGEIYTGEWQGGIKRFYPDTKKYEQVSALKKDNGIVSDIGEWKDHNGRNWLCVAMDEGFLLKDLQTDRSAFYVHDHKDPSSINAFYPCRLFTDKENRVWLASENGVCVIDPAGQYFSTHYLYYQVDENNPKKTGVPRAMLETDDGVMLSAWFAKGLSHYDKNWKLVKFESKVPAYSKSLYASAINGIYRAGDGITWFCTDSGLVKHQATKYSIFIPPAATNATRGDFIVRGILRRPDGLFWLKARQNGIYLFDPATGNFLRQYKVGEKNLAGDVYSLCYDQQSNLWVGSSEGVFLLDDKADTFQQISYASPGKIDAPQVYDLLCDTANMIWGASYNGLVKIDVTKRTAQLMTINDGLPDNILFRVQEDKNHFLWLKSQKGIIRYDKQSEFLFFTHENGLPDVYNAVLGLFDFTRNGRLLVGFNGSVTEFNPYEIHSAKTVPDLLLCDTYIDSKPVDLSNNRLTLAPGQKTLQVHFAITSYSIPSLNKYYYKVPGITNDWQEASNGNVSFSSLPHGHYTLYLKGINNNGTSSNEYQVAIVIQPYWYQTLAFKIAAGLLFSIIAYTMYRWRLNGVRKQAALRQKIVETEMQALRAQMNPHFIFNSLNSIENFIMQNERRLASDYLNKFARLVRMILDSSRNELVPFSKDMEALQLYVDLEQLRFNNKFEYNVSVDAALLHGDYKVPSLLIQPYVENAIVHGLAHCEEDDLFLSVKATLENDCIKYVIQDNGVGRETAAQYNRQNKPHHASVGLKITEERINIFNRQTSANGSIVIDDLFPGRTGAAGTKVQITIKAV